MRKRYALAVVDCSGDKVLTKQSFARETDINEIMKKYTKTGLLDPSQLATRQAQFADVSEIGDFQQCQEIVQNAQKAFMTLPAELRSRFDNEPAKLLDFCANDENKEEAIKLGIISKPSKTTPEPTPDPPPEGDPPPA